MNAPSSDSHSIATALASIQLKKTEIKLENEINIGGLSFLLFLDSIRPCRSTLPPDYFLVFFFLFIIITQYFNHHSTPFTCMHGFVHATLLCKYIHHGNTPLR